MYFEFVVHITEDPHSKKRVSDKFAEFLAGREPAEVHLREASCGFCHWPVEVLFEGQGSMYLNRGFDKFSREHNLEVECLLHLFYEADAEMNIKVFDESSCRRHYHDDDSGDDSGNNDGRL
ncbi:B3 domain-containing protein Os03g0212300-like [Lolium perenne]|jgi:hypothetical protein|uniref:B3 domain-containing protein Os03g0212300-like n=1 Tax=Lolium perenne TaxID=4522 RepID=UPI0021F52C56|nr:B3 domain-containing protein Os03g0212300-like [Lolium perenne]